MHIVHLAIWSTDIECLKSFYSNYFHAIAGAKYEDLRYQFSSYFLSFSKGPRLEIMQMPTKPASRNDAYSQFIGYVHMAFSVGSKDRVDELTSSLKGDGYRVVDEPRVTGDGYYESCVLDPDGNRIEITI